MLLFGRIGAQKFGSSSEVIRTPATGGRRFESCLPSNKTTRTMNSINWTTLILAIVTALLGGGNIFQWFLLRETKRKNSAEAYQAEINSLRTIIDGNVQEIQRLNTNYGELQDKYFALAEELQAIKSSMPKPAQKRKTSKKV